MNKLHLLVLLPALLAAGAQGQSAPPKELPSAPSATLEQQRQTAAPVQQPSAAIPQPSAPAPTQTAQPVIPAAPPEAKGGDGTSAMANNAQPSNNPDEYKFVKLVDEVNVIFTVTDKHGRFVKDLKKDDFKVLDDNKPPKAIGSFRAETNLPLRVGLLVDASNSVRDRFTFEQEAAIEFLNQIIRSRVDRAFVIGFDTTAEVTQDFTDDPEKLSKGVRSLRAGGGTALYDAIYYACRDKLRNAGSADRSTVRKAIILLSDGEDNQSRVTREEAVEMAQRAEVIVYAISTNVSGVKLRGDKILERLADATGGRAFFPFKVQDVANAFSEIQDELRSQYALAYKPSDLQSDGRFHSIDIEAQNHKNLKVRARKGYFAPKQ